MSPFVPVPGGQGGAATAPVMETNESTGAGRQPVCPDNGWYVPAEHAVSLLCPPEAT